jgi:hypothetical protein
VFLAITSLILVIAGFTRPALAIYDQRSAGKILSQVMPSGAGMTACEFPPLTDAHDLDQLHSAIAIIDRAIQYEARYSQSYLLLGRAACLLGRPDRAVEAFKMYTRLRPQNPLGNLELGFAEQNLCAYNDHLKEDSASLGPSDAVTGLCLNNDLMQEIRSDWQAYGIDTNQFLNLARQSFDRQKYSDAALWYQRALKFQVSSMDEMPMSDEFKWGISSILADSALPQSLVVRLPVSKLFGQLTIDPDQLRWFQSRPALNLGYADPIALRSGGDTEIGLLYWGGPAGILIDVQQDGWYKVSIRAQNSPPAPVNLQLEDNFQSFGKVVLARGDQSWQVFQLKTFLRVGVHVLDVNFTNDGMVDGVDRNAIVDWIKIERTG